MNGEHLGDLLSALLDGELDGPIAAAAQAHLGTCAICTVELDDVRLARTWVRELPALEPPAGFFERVLEDSEGSPSPRRRGSWWAAIGALAASAAAAVALVGLASPREPSVTPPVARLVEAHATRASVGDDPLSHLAPIGIPVSFRR
jgi:anti-sigma factor RsiW